MTRFILLLCLFYALSWLVLTYGGSVASFLFLDAVSNYRFVVLIIAAASYPLYAYADSIQKDVIADFGRDIADFGRDQARGSVEKLGALKKEILANIFAAFLLFVLQILASGFRQALLHASVTLPKIVEDGIIALEAACFLMGVLIGVVQFLGFLKATEFRSVMGKKG